MEKCKHVSKIRPAWDHSILNPEKWMCYLCHTTESVWACLSCSNVACGRFNEKHALKHFEESKHPISIEVNDKYVYCYVCDDYVLNDNAAGDIKLLRSALSAIATQKFTDIESRGRRLLRSYSHSGVVQRDNQDDDKIATAVWHHRLRCLAQVFAAWRGYVLEQKATKDRTLQTRLVSSSSTSLLKRTIIPGVTGLRNLGNTCYMNSVLQILSHTEDFRDFFLKMKYHCDVSPNGSPQVTKVMTPTTSSAVPSPSSALKYTRQSTVECFQHLMSPGSPSNKNQKKRSGGLSGGSAQTTPVRQHLICDVEARGSNSQEGNISLCGELHGVLRVLWSGKWAQVSPHAFLHAVWQAIPSFKGYAQHDAQEFLCELLDKIQQELDTVPKALQRADSKLLTKLCQGQLVSEVTCLACRKVSQTYEPYMDLSLEFPNRYQITKFNSRVAEDICHITEMLAKFTEEEMLDGEIYNCEKCNKNRKKSSGIKYTRAKKQLLINTIPPILRLHLKRFRWSGRDHREKIKTHVAADEVLDLKPFCSGRVKHPTYNYRLFGVIIHHGKGFGSGHYTSFTWNSEADHWVNCNDSRMILSTLEDVLSAQAYILFYKVDNVDKPSPPLYPVNCTSDLQYRLKSGDSLDLSPELKMEATSSGHKMKSMLKSDGTVKPSTSAGFKIETSPGLKMESMLTSGRTVKSSASPGLKIAASPRLKETANPGLKMKSMLTPDGTVKTSAQDVVKVVDCEVSFNFKPPSDGKNGSTVQTRSAKRSLEAASRVSDVKRKKLSFDTDTFYAGRNTPPKKTQAAKRKGLLNSGQKQGNSAGKKAKEVFSSTPARHIKRRKSSLW